MIFDRDIIDADDYDNELDESGGVGGKKPMPSSKTEECDLNCLSAFYERLVDGKDDGQDEPNQACFSVRDKLEFMHALVCRNVLSDMDRERDERSKHFH